MKFNYSFYNIILEETDRDVFLYNSYSGALCKLEKDIHKLIMTTELDDSDKCKYFDELYSQGFIKPIELNEFNKIILSERINVLHNFKNKLSFVIAPTLACNLNCDYCFESAIRNNKVISDDMIISVADFILSKLGAGIKEVHISWFGGEPLIAYSQIIRFSNYFIPKVKKLGVAYTASMISNGLLLDGKKAKVLSEQCFLRDVQITLDGTCDVYCQRKKAKPEQYNRLIQNIKAALKYLKVSLRLNCDGNNFEDLKQAAWEIVAMCGNNKNLSMYLAKLIDYVKCGGSQYFDQDSFDVKRIEFDKYICTILNKPYQKKPIRYRPTFCGLYKLHNLAIGPDGELYKCEHHVGQENRVIGNISYGYNYNDFMMEFIQNDIRVKCKFCKIFPLCLGGCPAQKLDLPQDEPCFYSEKYIKSILERYINSVKN